MSQDGIDKLLSLGSISEERLAATQTVGQIDLTLTALAVAIEALSRVSPPRDGGDLGAMKLMFHELADHDGELWQERARYLLDGEE